MSEWQGTLGAVVDGEGTSFRVWAPEKRAIELVIEPGSADEQRIPMEGEPDGYWNVFVGGLGAGIRYAYLVNGDGPFPDPCSRAQPEGVHGPSLTVEASTFAWSDGEWAPPDPRDLVIYECHIGTFTKEGTFDAAVGELVRLRDLGISALEIMPVASFPGSRNWGYDGVDLFAPAAPYGGPEGLRRLVDAAHSAGIAVLLDVVFNHFGPDGNYTGVFSEHYVTTTHQTPWGDAVNFDDVGSNEVRRFVIENLLHWVHEYHADGFRFDATHAIRDDSGEHILAATRRELGAHSRGGQPPILIAETHENDARYLRSPQEGGFGFDAVWADDFHNVLRNVMHSEREGYLESFAGSLEELATVVSRGWLFEGQPDPASGVPRGGSAAGIPWRSFVYCLQNHDQVGNRAFGERAHQTANPDDLLAATFFLLLLPQTPLIFQGQEVLATTPFLYFTDHNAELGEMVTKGRREEFAGFAAFRDPEAAALIPDPQAVETFLRSKLRDEDRERAEGRGALALHRELLRIRREDPVLNAARQGRCPVDTTVSGRALVVRLRAAGGSRLLAANFGGIPERVAVGDIGGLVSSREERFGRAPAAAFVERGELVVPGHAGVFAIER